MGAVVKERGNEKESGRGLKPVELSVVIEKLVGWSDEKDENSLTVSESISSCHHVYVCVFCMYIVYTFVCMCMYLCVIYTCICL